MTRFAFCAQSLERSAAVVAGVRPLTSPPISLANEPFDPAWLNPHAFLFFKLHGQEGQPQWYGDHGVTAVTAEQLRQASIPGAMVFAANCYGGPASPMVHALLDAGAAVVVTGTGLNWAGTNRVDGIDVMAMAWRFLLERGLDADSALRLGKDLALIRRPRLAADIRSFTLVGQTDARLRMRERQHDAIGASQG